jgi:hypothetical protein
MKPSPQCQRLLSKLLTGPPSSPPYERIMNGEVSSWPGDNETTSAEPVTGPARGGLSRRDAEVIALITHGYSATGDRRPGRTSHQLREDLHPFRAYHKIGVTKRTQGCCGPSTTAFKPDTMRTLDPALLLRPAAGARPRPLTKAPATCRARGDPRAGREEKPATTDKWSLGHRRTCARAPHPGRPRGALWSGRHRKRPSPSRRTWRRPPTVLDPQNPLCTRDIPSVSRRGWRQDRGRGSGRRAASTVPPLRALSHRYGRV